METVANVTANTSAERECKEQINEKKLVQSEDNQEKGNVISSPMVGTFYLKPSPNAEPYVTVGQKVKKGDVVCIIEAMKLMNEIEAECDGVIEDILVKDGESVEYGRPLFRMGSPTEKKER